MTLVLTPHRAAVAHADGAGSPTGQRDAAYPQPAVTRTIGHGAQRPVRAPVCRTNPRRRRADRDRIDALICEISTVLINRDPAVVRDIETRHDLRMGSMLETLQDWPTALLASVGLLDHTTWLRYARETLPPQAVDEWLAYNGTINQPVIDLLTLARRGGVRLFLLANGTQQLRDDLAHHQLTDLAERTYLSVDIGYAKPDPRAYAHVVRDASLTPAQTLCVDHVPSWVRTSRQLGLRGHVYIDAEQLRRELAQAGAIA